MERKVVLGSRNGSRCKFCAWQIELAPSLRGQKKTNQKQKQRNKDIVWPRAVALDPELWVLSQDQCQSHRAVAAGSCCLPELKEEDKLLLCHPLLHPRFGLKHSMQESAEGREEKQHLQPPHWDRAGQPQLQNERQDHEVCEAGNGGRAERSFGAASAAANNRHTVRNSSWNHVCALMNDSKCVSEPSTASWTHHRPSGGIQGSSGRDTVSPRWFNCSGCRQGKVQGQLWAEPRMQSRHSLGEWKIQYWR